jgi:hypothetical protein
MLRRLCQQVQIAPDCSVDFFFRLPARGDPEFVGNCFELAATKVDRAVAIRVRLNHCLPEIEITAVSDSDSTTYRVVRVWNYVTAFVC